MGDISTHFSRWEFSCKCGCDFNTVDHELIVVLEELRTYFDRAITINSGNRCVSHNKKVGGSRYSQHLVCKASDVVVENVGADAVADYLEERFSTKYGIGRYDGRTHIDVRSNKARWDKRSE